VRQYAIALFLVSLPSTSMHVLADETSKPAALTKENVEFFETNIRPILAEHCYKCHSAQERKSKGGLQLDTQAAVAKGGDNGAVIVPGDVNKSRLVQAIRWADPDFVMPPKEKLTAKQIEKLEQWVKMGAPDPRKDPGSQSALANKIASDTGRNWWAFQPIKEMPEPAVKQPAWAKKKIDFFVLKDLEAKNLTPSAEADPRTLLQRAYLDLTGLRPTFEQAEAFAKDPSPQAYEKVVEQLLASPLYGQRWGRYWLDVARYGEDNPTSEATNPPYPYAWRYRDWVIQAINKDVPYDRFVSLQLAGDLIPGTPRSDLAATGFLGAGPLYHKDGRLSKDVIENLYMDDWDERVDVVSRGILGLTVACARCHDHKFDPISSKDYYSLASVFASTVGVVRPIAEVDATTESRFMLNVRRLFYLSYAANLMRNEPGSNPRGARQQVEKIVKELDKIEDEIAPLRKTHPDLHAYLVKLDRRPNPYPGQTTIAGVKQLPAAAGGKGGKGGRGGSTEPYFQGILEAGVWVNGSDPDLTMIDLKLGEPHDLRVLQGGNVTRPADPAPRGFLSVLAKGDPAFQKGSGRLELAERIFTDAAPLTARVIVNRAWAWHFGKPLVDTPSDFGAQGEKPTHPQLLDDLAARFIANGWSLKWLHREIMLSSVYKQSSQPRADALKIDPGNRLLWRMNSRRLDIEAFHDCLLQATGSLDTSLGGPSAELDQIGNGRRAVYSRVSRGRLNNLLQLYGFPEATMHSPSRETTTTPLQQLFVMNSAYMRDQARTLAQSVSKVADAGAKVRLMYHKVLGRDPTSHELQLGTAYLADGSATEYAQALLCTNEVIYWP
jgi:hypothetical protein